MTITHADALTVIDKKPTMDELTNTGKYQIICAFLRQSMIYDQHLIVFHGRRPKKWKQAWNTHGKAGRKQYDSNL